MIALWSERLFAMISFSVCLLVCFPFAEECFISNYVVNFRISECVVKKNGYSVDLGGVESFVDVYSIHLVQT